MIIRGKTAEAKAARAARDARIVALAKAGQRPAKIAPQFPGMSTGIVRTIVQRARESGEEIPFFQGGPALRAAGEGPPRCVKLSVPAHALEGLAAGAVRRGTSLSRLAARIVATVAAEGLIDAVLDDHPERSEAA